MLGTGTRLIDKYKFVFGTAAANYTGAASTSDIVSLKNYNHATVVIPTGAWAGGTAAVTLTQCQDVAGTGAKALTFDTMFTNAGDVTKDAYVKTDVASNTFNLAVASAVYVIEVNASDLDVNNGFDCLRVDVASPGGNNDLYSVMLILGNPARYGNNYAVLPSAIVD